MIPNYSCKDHEPTFYGSASIGERGQIVIPSDLRTKLDIKAGEKFVFFSNGDVIFMHKAENVKKMLENMTKLLELKDKIEKDISEDKKSKKIKK